MRTLALLSTVLLAAAPVGDTVAPQGPDVAVHCGTLYVSPTVTHEDAWLVVRDGKVAAIVTDGQPPDDLPVVDASDKTVIPGLVIADTDLSGHGDDEYNVTPDFVALDGFDFLREFEVPLSGGVTTVYLAPGRNRLVPGQGSVVKLAGDDMVHRVLAETACLRLTLGALSTQAPPVFEPTVFPTADDPLEPARRQYPSARISQLATLRDLFREAQTTENGGPTGPGPVENRYDSEPLRLAALGRLPLRIAAQEAADVRRALAFADTLGQVPILENPIEVAPLASQLRGVPVVFRAPMRLSESNPGGENRLDERPVERPENPGIAARAGAKVALAPGRNDDLSDMLLLAGIAVRFGLPEEAALAAVTSTAAEMLGVADRVGTLEVGKDADFAVLSGRPLAVGTMVEQTWVDGEKVYQREVESSLLALRAPEILTGTGETIRDGVVLIEDGRIKGVGADLAVPYGARIVEIDGVVAPGFVDANSTLGLSGAGVGVPNGTPDQRIADVLEFDDDTFAASRDAGITTLLVSGADQALASGRIAAVKTGAADHESMVLREIAGVRFVFDEIGPESIKPLAAEIEKGKKYIEAWEKYEKAVAEWKAGKREKPPEEAAPAETNAPPPDPVSGTWECQMELPQMGRTLDIVLELELKGTAVTGTAQISFGENQLPPTPIESGTFQNGELRANVRFMRNEAEMVAKISNDSLEGTIQAMGQDAKITGRRTAKPGQRRTAAKADDGEPKKPKVDEAMEAMRALIEKRATAVIRVDKAPAIQAVAKLFTDEGIRFALHGAGDLVDTPGLIDSPTVMIGPEIVMQDKGKIVNAAAELADAGAALAIVTGDNAGTRYLPLHAMHAIRYGMDPEAALNALTIGPARMFGLEDRIGSIERGKDADLVVFSGSPFEPTSRVLLVVCNGRIVHDARQEATR